MLDGVQWTHNVNWKRLGERSLLESRRSLQSEDKTGQLERFERPLTNRDCENWALAILGLSIKFGGQKEWLKTPSAESA